MLRKRKHITGPPQHSKLPKHLELMNFADKVKTKEYSRTIRLRRRQQNNSIVGSSINSQRMYQSIDSTASQPNADFNFKPVPR